MPYVYPNVPMRQVRICASFIYACRMGVSNQVE
jgi:hypothetical protein